MADISFDDLIPKQPKGRISFDDLIPQPKGAPLADPWAEFKPVDQWAEFKEVPAHPNAAPQGLGAQIAQQAKNAYVATHDIGRLLLNGATLGQADRLAAAINGHTLEQERAETARSTERAGIPGELASFIGGAAPMGIASKALGAVGVAQPYLNAALSGGAVGAGEAAGKGEDIGSSALIGAGAGAAGHVLGNAITGGVSKVAGAFNPKVPVPTAQELQSAVTPAYDRAEALGGIVNKTASQRLADALRQRAADFGYDPAMQPKSAGFFNRLKDYEGKSVTMKELDTLRKVAGRTWEGDASDAELGRRLKSEIDQFTGNLQPSDLIAGMGNAHAANQAFQEARGLAQRNFKVQDLADALAKSERQTAASGSGGNIENNMRRNVGKMLEGGNLTPDEEAAVWKVLKPGAGHDALRLAGKASPEGNGLSMMLHLGAAGLTAGHTLPMAAAGAVAKRASDALTRRNVSKLADLLASGGNAAALQPAPNAVQRFAEAKRDMLARALMSGGLITGERALSQ